MIIHPDRIPKLECRNGGPDDWTLICEGRVIARGLSEYMATILAAAPAMLGLLDMMSRREHAPARIPIENVLHNNGIEFWRPESGADNSEVPSGSVQE